METKTVKGKLRAKCPRCKKWGDAETDFYWRDKGTKLYAHKPCEIARSVASHAASPKAKAEQPKKTAAKKRTAKAKK